MEKRLASDYISSDDERDDAKAKEKNAGENNVDAINVDGGRGLGLGGPEDAKEGKKRAETPLDSIIARYARRFQRAVINSRQKRLEKVATLT